MMDTFGDEGDICPEGYVTEETYNEDIAEKDVEIERLRVDKDQAYLERNHLVAALARLFPSGIARTNIPDWDPEWHGCVYIDLPTGQISYHYHDSQAHLFQDLTTYYGEWDGHDKDAVHHRMSGLRKADDNLM